MKAKLEQSRGMTGRNNLATHFFQVGKKNKKILQTERVGLQTKKQNKQKKSGLKTESDDVK